MVQGLRLSVWGQNFKAAIVKVQDVEGAQVGRVLLGRGCRGQRLKFAKEVEDTKLGSGDPRLGSSDYKLENTWEYCSY